MNSSNSCSPSHELSADFVLVRNVKLCSKSRKCSKQDKHKGRCNTERKFHAFWEASRVQVHHTLKREFKDANEQLRSDYQTKSAKFVDVEDREERVLERESECGRSIFLFAVWFGFVKILLKFLNSCQCIFGILSLMLQW